MLNKLLVPALVPAAGAAQAEGLPGVTDGPGPNLVIEVADGAGQPKGKIVRGEPPANPDRMISVKVAADVQ